MLLNQAFNQHFRVQMLETVTKQMDVLLLDFFNNSIVTLTIMHGSFPFKTSFKYIFAEIQFFSYVKRNIIGFVCVCVLLESLNGFTCR